MIHLKDYKVGATMSDSEEIKGLLQEEDGESENETELTEPGNPPEPVVPDISYEEAVKLVGYGCFHWQLLALCGWAISSNAIEMSSVSYVLPRTTCDMSLSDNDKGWINASVFAGMLVGGYLWGSLADIFGRRVILFTALLLNGLGTLGASAAQSFWLFIVMRIISGVGVGGSIPVIFTYFTEFQAKARRGSMMALLSFFWMFGAITSASTAWLVIPWTGLGFTTPGFSYQSWRVYLALCALPSLSSAILYLLTMPESPKFLLQIGEEEKAREVLRMMYRKNVGNMSPYFLQDKKLVLFHAGEGESNQITASTLLTGKRNFGSLCIISAKVILHILKSTVKILRPPFITKTILLSIVSFAMSFGYDGLVMWMPMLFDKMEKYGGSPCHPAQTNLTLEAKAILNETGCEPVSNKIYQENLLLAICTLPGNILSVIIMDRVGRKPMLAFGMVTAGTSVCFIILLTNKVEALIMSCIFVGFSVIAWNPLNVIAAELFPTHLRGSAFGLEMIVGQVAGILSNVMFGKLVSTNCAAPIATVAAFLIVGGLTALKLPETKAKDVH